MSQKSGKELRKLQKELVDEILTNPEGLQAISNAKCASLQGFHQYSFNNLILANYELYGRTGKGIQLLAPYKKWADVNRHVKKGEKALRIIAPIQKKIGEDEEGNPEYVTWFKSVPVFDVSQTDGEPLVKYFAKFTGNEFNLNEITARCKVKVNFIEGEIRRGCTDGKEIYVSSDIPVERQICTFFHELAHYNLHFDANRNEIKRETKELEAEAVSFIVSNFLGINDKSSPAYILEWTKNYDDDKRAELLKGKGSNVLKCAEKIIDDLKLNELLESKKNAPTLSNWDNINWVGVKDES